jgi:hypothetical protein
MDMEIDFKNYQLSQELRGHEDDVTTFLFPSQFFYLQLNLTRLI